MANATAEWELQKAIYSELAADAGVKALIGDPARLYDHVSASPTYPYVTLGEAIAIDESTFGKLGQEHMVDVDTWSRYRGAKEAKEIMSVISKALHEATLTLSGFDHAGIMLDFSQLLRDPDGITRHGVQRFKAITLEQ